ncbi:MAG: lipopolysaccharide biosynthesis protein [Clostridiales bacterium]|nr:lipopolysaccharide biosynthesis protein [Clostridiales bacterium]
MLKKWLFGNEQHTRSSGVIWNAIGGAMNAGQSAIVLIFISHCLGLVTAGMVTIAYAVAQVFYYIAKYGVRNFQVTDVAEQYSFRDYFRSRVLSLVLAVIILVFYLLYGFGSNEGYLEKGMIILEVVILKLIDAFEDVFLGRYQQVGRLDIGAKIMAVRLVISTALICAAVLAGVGIHLSLALGILVSVLLDFWFIGRTFSAVSDGKKSGSRHNVWKLMKVCLPLCAGTTLAIYIGNVPKYMINSYMNEETQAIFGYIMMPVFVIMLLNNFIYQPVIKDLGELWEQREIRLFRKKVFRQCLIVAGLTAVIMVIGLTIGLPILSVLYNADLTGYQAEFAVLFLGGGCYAIASYLNVPITTIRKQNFIAVGYGAAAVFALTCGRFFVISRGMMGAAFLYLLVNALLVIVYAAVLAVGLKKPDKR